MLAKDLQSIKRKKVSQKAHQSLKAPPLVLSSNHLEESYSFHLLYEEILKEIKQPKLYKK